MKKTSHFVGITLKPEKFVNIFTEIHQFLWENCKKIIEFQNILSLHITLYYFPKELSKNDLNTIKNIISKIDLKDVNIIFWWFQYFWEKVAYLWYKNHKLFKQLNHIFHQNFPKYNTIIDNSYEKYIPHTTIFKIKEYDLYLTYKEEIEKIVLKNLEKISTNEIWWDINLYAVNSTFSPEIQIMIQ